MVRNALRAVKLTCEYKTKPHGIEVSQPRLSWQVESVDPQLRNARQIAYQVQVATCLELLNSSPDLWDSGKLESSNSLHIQYQGTALHSLQDVVWRVRIWNQDDEVSAWSDTGLWSMGLLESSGWTASWLQAPAVSDFTQCRWIWAADEPLAHFGARAGTVQFQYEMQISAEAKIATLLLSTTGHFWIQINDVDAGNNSGKIFPWDQSHEINLHHLIHSPGHYRISIFVQHTNEGDPAGVTGKVILETIDNRQYIVPLDETWSVCRVDAQQCNRSQSTTSFAPAAVLAQVGETTPEGNSCQPWGVPGREDGLMLSPVPMFRSDFSLDIAPRRARLVVACLGICDVRINNELVAPDQFSPGWCDYRHRVYYRVYDVTALVQFGSNTVTVALADGWYAGYVAWGRRRNRYGGLPSFCLQMHVDCADGETMIIESDESWKVTSHTPWQEADLLMGETYDARQDQCFSRSSNSDNHIWSQARIALTPQILIESHPGDPVLPQEELRPVQIMEPKPGQYIFDMAQNMVGIVRLVAVGPAGTRIKLQYAEVLQEDGTLYTEALRGARSTDTYIKKSDEPEVWTPRFTFHGFRYVALTGLSCSPTLETITGIVLHTFLERTGYFSSSSQLVNQLYHNIIWGQKGNYLEIPTDCPQRDERAGWTGDAQIFMRTGSFNFNTGAFFTKWLVDLFDSQTAEGWFCCVAPEIDISPNANICYMGWADAAIICPYILYQVYGDTRAIEKYWKHMARYVRYLETSSNELIRPDAGFGDWVSLNAPTPVDLVGTAYFAHDAQLMAEMADMLCRQEEADYYRELFKRVKHAFQTAFLGSGGTPKDITQTSLLLALRFDLLPNDARDRAVELLAQDLSYRGHHFSTGFLGLKELLPALSEEGRHDLAMRVLLQDEFPSWGYEIRNGATTIWERWDGWSEELGLQTPAMNSFNHYAFGAVGEWLFMHLAGITLAEPGYRSIEIQPRPTSRLQHVRAAYDSPCGTISSQWWQKDQVLYINCRVPANVTATIHLPAGPHATILESETAIEQATGLWIIERTESEIIVNATSGYYQFAVTEN